MEDNTTVITFVDGSSLTIHDTTGYTWYYKNGYIKVEKNRRNMFFNINQVQYIAMECDLE